jgi:hypothetical protein
MPDRGWISLCGLAAAAVAAALSAHVTTAAALPAKPALSPPTTDVTYSCPVQASKLVDVYAGVKNPVALIFDTGIETDTVNGVTSPKPQASVKPQSNGVTIDTKNCTKLKKRIAFSTKGLPKTLTATRGHGGSVDKACKTAAAVVFRLQVHSSDTGPPTSAVLALRNDNAKSKPIALVYWSPRRVRVHLESGCRAPSQ